MESYYSLQHKGCPISCQSCTQHTQKPSKVTSLPLGLLTPGLNLTPGKRSALRLWLCSWGFFAPLFSFFSKPHEPWSSLYILGQQEVFVLVTDNAVRPVWSPPTFCTLAFTWIQIEVLVNAEEGSGTCPWPPMSRYAASWKRRWAGEGEKGPFYWPHLGCWGPLCWFTQSWP